jgi:hypothetical protein
MDCTLVDMPPGRGCLESHRVKRTGVKRGIGNLAFLFPCVKRHAWTLAACFAFMLVQNYGSF